MTYSSGTMNKNIVVKDYTEHVLNEFVIYLDTILKMSLNISISIYGNITIQG
jgi:hypothetical protein